MADTINTEAPETQETPAFEIPSEYVEDGKILGKYSSTQEVLDALAAANPAPVVSSETLEVAETQEGEGGELGLLTVEEPAQAPGGLSSEALSNYAQEAIKDGKLSEDSLKALEAAGIDRGLADMHVKGLLAQRELAAQKVAKLVGGEEAVKNALAWAKANLSEAERVNTNAALDSAPSPEIQAAIIESLIKRSGALPKSVGGTNQAPVTGQPYPSEAQWLQDVKSSKYSEDPAFRDQVEQRLKSTMRTGGFKFV